MSAQVGPLFWYTLGGGCVGAYPRGTEEVMLIAEAYGMDYCMFVEVKGKIVYPPSVVARAGQEPPDGGWPVTDEEIVKSEEMNRGCPDFLERAKPAIDAALEAK